MSEEPPVCRGRGIAGATRFGYISGRQTSCFLSLNSHSTLTVTRLSLDAVKVLFGRQAKRLRLQQCQDRPRRGGARPTDWI
jgi:hypothetical protein